MEVSHGAPVGPRRRAVRVSARRTRRAVALDRRARAGRQLEDEAQIVERQQPQPEDLLLVDEVTDVRAREAPAGGARAVLVERPRVAGEAGVPEVQPARPSECAAGARRAGRQDAVEHVDARARSTLEDPLRVADAHEVARSSAGSSGAAQPTASNSCLAALADREPAERVAVEVERRDLLDRARGAARDRRRPGRCRRRAGRARAARRRCALGPRGRAAHRAARAPRRGESAGGQMSRHIAMSEPSAAWIAAALSGVKRAAAPSYTRAERDAVVVDGEDRVAQREDLEAARVGQDRPVPAA